jgi:hypothetical protein
MATLFPGQSLLPGQSLQSDTGVYTLTMQSDGNVVLYNNEHKPLWWTNTGGGLIDPLEFSMQTDGNLVLYDTSGQARWASKTQGNPGAFLNMQNDGNGVVYRAGATTETANNALWSTGTSVPPPLTLQTVVDSGAMLNVGNADLTYLSYDMLFGSGDVSVGRSASYTEQGSWTSADVCGATGVTVNAHIEANWGSGPGWTWQNLQGGFAGALGAVMQAVSSPTAYENYSYTPEVTPDGLLTCYEAQFLDLGYHIPAAIQITAHDNTTGDMAGQVTLRYSTEDQSGGGVDVCGLINEVNGVVGIFPEAAPLVAVVGAVTGLVCGLLGG